jgi:hypothetical protein
MSRSVLALVLSVAVSIVLVGAYAALGESTPAAPVVDPCAPREWRHTNGVEAAIEQIVLSTADGAACDLGVSREELLLALGSGSELGAFAAEHDITRADAEAAIRKGLDSAIGEAEGADAIGGGTARLLRQISASFPISVLLTVLGNASALVS